MTRHLWRWRTFAAVMVVPGLLLAACGDDDDDAATATTEASGGESGDAAWDEVVAAANEEGSLVFYSAQGVPVIEALIESFNEEYPDINVEYIRGATGELVARLDQEIASSVTGADLVMMTELPWFERQAESAGLLDLDSPSLDGWPTEYLRGTADEPFVIPGYEPYVIGVNTAQAQEDITTYEDLLHESLRGRLGMPDLASTTLVIWYSWIEEQYGEDFLRELAAQDPVFYAGATPMANAVGSGEVAAGGFQLFSVLEPLVTQGAPIEISVPDPALGFGFGLGALENAGNPNAAKVFIDFVLSPSGQEAIHGGGGSVSPLDDIPGELELDSEFTLIDFEGWTQERIDEFTAHWNSIFIN